MAPLELCTHFAGRFATGGIAMSTSSHAPTVDRTGAHPESAGAERLALERGGEIAEIQKLLGEIQGTWSELLRSMRELRECLESQVPANRREG